MSNNLCLIAWIFGPNFQHVILLKLTELRMKINSPNLSQRPTKDKGYPGAAGGIPSLE